MAKKIRTAEPQQKITGSYEKKRVYSIKIHQNGLKKHFLTISQF